MTSKLFAQYAPLIRSLDALELDGGPSLTAKLRLAQGATASVLYLASGEEFRLKGAGRYQIGPKAPTALQGAQPEKRKLPVDAIPPAYSLASRHSVRSPPRCRMSAEVRPLWPAPITIASNCSAVMGPVLTGRACIHMCFSVGRFIRSRQHPLILGGCRAKWLSASEGNAPGVVRPGVSRNSVDLGGSDDGRVDDAGVDLVA